VQYSFDSVVDFRSRPHVRHCRHTSRSTSGFVLYELTWRHINHWACTSQQHARASGIW